MKEREPIKLHVTAVGSCIRKNVLQLQGVEPTEPPNYHAIIGTIVHKIGELLLKDYMKGEVSHLSDYIEKAVYELNYINFYEEFSPHVIEKTEKLAQWLEENPTLAPTSLEQTIELPLMYGNGKPMRIKGRPVLITGTPDIVTKDEIIDLKSGKTRSKGHALQLAAYNVMLSSSSGDEKMRTGRVVYLGAEFSTKVQKNGKVKKGHERVLNEDQINKYTLEWLNMLLPWVEGIGVNYADIPDPEQCKDCFFCSYSTLCGMNIGGSVQ